MSQRMHPNFLSLRYFHLGLVIESIKDLRGASFWLQINFISCILCIFVFYSLNMNNYCYGHIFKIHNFKVKNTFEPNVLKWVIKKIIKLSPFAFLIINVKIDFNFQKELCTFGIKKMDVWEKQRLSTFKIWMFWHTKTFFICVKLWACKIFN